MYQNLFDRLSQSKMNWKNEEEVRIGWVKELSQSLDIEMHAERRRQDSSYNNVIIEFKAPGLFHGRKTSPAFEEAMNERLKPYILRQAESEGIPREDFIGIGIDGEHICFAQVKNEKIIFGDLLPFSLSSVTMVATALQDSYRRAITVENLVEDFGMSSSVGSQLMQVLANGLGSSLNDSTNNKVKMLFEEWRTLFGQVADLTHNQRIEVRKIIKFTLPSSTPEHLVIPISLFVIHTYNSLVIKLLAAEIVSAHGLSGRSIFAQTTANLTDNQLLFELNQQIEQGQLFDSAGIKGFVEEAIFSWYIDLCTQPEYKNLILSFVRDLLIRLSFYRTDTLNDIRTRDVLKGFYQTLVPDSLRKSLGEFYTPDWLVDFTLNKLDEPQWLNDRILDPTCGSGSFLIGAISRIRLEAEKQGIPPEKLVSLLTENVWGFDLNPLAVQTARVNYLIAIADLLQASPGQVVELPILLADAIYSPARHPNKGEEIVTYTIGSEIANLQIKIPAELVSDRKRLDQIFFIMGEQVGKNASFSDTIRRLTLSRLLNAEEVKEWEVSLSQTYNQVLELHQRNWNGIWFRIVRNFFWSATAGLFQIIVGNPPWVRWSNLPELYRERIKPTCRQYEIFSSTPHHGGNELDVSGMITYTVADKWLETDGQLAFILTQSHFQTPSSEGFRSFSINGVDKLIPLSVDDLKSLKPFPAANKTAVALFRKQQGIEPKYPVAYTLWDAAEGYPKVIPSQLPYENVIERIQSNLMEATPVNSLRSPWAILPPGRFQILDRISGTSTWVNGRKGVTTDLNGIFFVRVVKTNEETGLVQIETRPEAGKTDIGPKQSFWVEPHMLFPLLKGAGDFTESHLNIEDDLYAIIPNKGVTKEACEEVEILLDSICQRTRNYFKTFEHVLRARSTWRRYLKGKPYYTVYNVGDYTFSPYKVVWAEQSSRFTAAVVSDKEVPLVGRRPFVPDHKIFYVAFDNAEAAYYLCGLLNSNVVREYVESHNVSINVGNIFKHMNLPRFDPDNEGHLKLARLVQEAHHESSEELLSKIRKFSDSLLL